MRILPARDAETAARLAAGDAQELAEMEGRVVPIAAGRWREVKHFLA